MFAIASSLTNKPLNESSKAPPSVAARYGGAQMTTSMIVAEGMYVAVGITWDMGIPWTLSGLGMSTKAMWMGAGVGGGAQLEKSSTQISPKTEGRIMYLTSNLNFKLKIHGREDERQSFYF
jgi:hypothetical protein